MYKRQLRQILTNIIANAIKFTEQGDVIIKVQMVRENASKVDLVFEIKDTGIGNPEEAQARLFQPFT